MARGGYSVQSMVIVDVGSTTTKALLFGLQGTRWTYLERGEAATTVEQPDEDVMIGVRRAIERLEVRYGMKLLESTSGSVRVLSEEFLATSSAGGGLQMIVCGNVLSVTGESAQRAALGGGAILLDVFAADDGRQHFHRLERLRSLRPDMILLCGGIEGASNVNFMIEMADFIRTAKPRPKFGYENQLPVIYAGASGGAPIVMDLLGEDFIVKIVPNLRPSFGKEDLAPARAAIHDLFIEHVMSNAPGYDTLKREVTQTILPTPSAVGEILTRYAQHSQNNILCVDIGGATTDVFSVVDGRFVRSVSANYGMSYSIGNVAAVAGFENISRWLPATVNTRRMTQSIAAKFLHPTSLPMETEDVFIEHAVAREALRLAFLDHQELATIQAGKKLFENELLLKTQRIRIDDIDVLIGSGGVLSNTPKRGHAAAMLLDAFQPVGCTELYVDSVFMLPHLGVLTEFDADSALYILEQDGLVPLGTALVPTGAVDKGQLGIEVKGTTSEGLGIAGKAHGGELVCLPLAAGETAEIEVRVHRGAQWHGQTRFTVRGGTCGLILDMRGRPLSFAEGSAYNTAWLDQLCQTEIEQEG